MNGQPVTLHPPDPGCRFRAFATLEDGARDYLRGMYSHWTKAWHYVCAGDPQGFAQGLHDQGYYTASVASYAAGVQHYFDLYVKTLTITATSIPADAPTLPVL